MLAGERSLELLEPEGGWYAVFRVAGGRSDEDLAIEIMRKARVLVHPGHFYDFPGEGYLIVSLIVAQENFRNGMAGVVDNVTKTQNQ
jgi:hypothetical protein